MKLTWFGGTALRAYAGGEIFVVDAQTAAQSVSREELRSGADRLIGLDDGALPRIDAERWAPVRAGRALDEPRAADVLSIGAGTCLISGEGDPPLLISNAIELPRLGRWADDAVILLFGHRGAMVAEAIVALDLARPRRLVLAAGEDIVERLLERLDRINDRLWSDLAFSSLEPGLALEV